MIFDPQWNTDAPVRVDIVGATGAVGREALEILAHPRFRSRVRVRALASERSAGSAIPFAEGSLTVHPLREDSFDPPAPNEPPPVAIFATDADVSRRFAGHALRAGATVIDNSSAFRLDPDVPLVVPEVNADRLRPRNAAQPRLIANPNCSAAILLVALDALRRAFGIRSVVVATYQAVSGAGIAAMDELVLQARQVIDGNAPQPRVFHEPCAFNVFSHDSAMCADSGLNGEEKKIIAEARKIWDDPALGITPTCVRVPVLRAHTQAVTVRLHHPATIDQVQNAYQNAPGVSLIDDRLANRFPTPLKAAHQDDVLVGRLRPDPAKPPDEHGRHTSFCLLACGDQLRKGAALNAIQIAQAANLIPA